MRTRVVGKEQQISCPPQWTTASNHAPHPWSSLATLANQRVDERRRACEHDASQERALLRPVASRLDQTRTTASLLARLALAGRKWRLLSLMMTTTAS